MQGATGVHTADKGAIDMPIKALTDLPKVFQGLPEMAKQIALAVLSRVMPDSDSEEDAIRLAWASIGARFMQNGDSWVVRSDEQTATASASLLYGDDVSLVSLLPEKYKDLPDSMRDDIAWRFEGFLRIKGMADKVVEAIDAYIDESFIQVNDKWVRVMASASDGARPDDNLENCAVMVFPTASSETAPADEDFTEVKLFGAKTYYLGPEIQVFPAPGVYYKASPYGGKLKYDLSGEVIPTMVKNFNNHVTGTWVPLDYNHRTFVAGEAGKAAGFCVPGSMYQRKDGTAWVVPVYTKAAKQGIIEGEWIGQSPEWRWDYPDRTTPKRTFGPTMVALALTNSKLFWTMAHVKASSQTPGTKHGLRQKEQAMFSKAFLESLGLNEGATEADVVNAIGQRDAQHQEQLASASAELTAVRQREQQLSAQQFRRDVGEALDTAEREGKILPSQRAYFEQSASASSDALQAFKAWSGGAAKVNPPTNMQGHDDQPSPGDQRPAGPKGSAMTSEQAVDAVCEQIDVIMASGKTFEEAERVVLADPKNQLALRVMAGMASSDHALAYKR